MPVFSRTVVTAAEILRSIPANEDDLYTSRGKLRRAQQPGMRCQAGVDTDHHCPFSAETDGLCIPHWRRRKYPPKRYAWDSPVKPYRTRRRF